VKRLTFRVLILFLIFSPLSAYAINDGTLITGPERKTILIIKDGEKHFIPNWDTFLGNRWSYDSVVVISHDAIDAIPDGDPIPPVGYDIKNEECGLNSSKCTAHCIAPIETAQTYCNCIPGICNAICKCLPK